MMNNPDNNNAGVSLQVRGLRKSFGAQEVLKGIDLDVQPGEIFVIMGPSGSGKSVLLKHLIGLEAPDAGEILINGESIESDVYKRQDQRRSDKSGNGLPKGVSNARRPFLWMARRTGISSACCRNLRAVSPRPARRRRLRRHRVELLSPDGWRKPIPTRKLE